VSPGSPSRYYDEDGDELGAPIPNVPVGAAGLASYRVIDDWVSDELGIPRAPE
jgi:hypothetical protein